MTGDPFSTQRLRDAVLAAWDAQPSRLREDANAEEDQGRGYYRDRLVVELAQNAADAAVRGGVRGRLLLRLTDGGDTGVLVAANVGAPLDAAGVASLSTLRASAKRDGAGGGTTVGRFGVGFAAVRSVADEITVASTTGAVHFSMSRTAGLLADAEPALAVEVSRRLGALPVLRLPFDGPGRSDVGALGDGWDTVVVMTLRDAAAVHEVRRQMAALDDPLLLALPGLAAVEIDDDGATRVVQDVASRWVVATRTGTLPRELLADRPVEERERTGWQITWAVRRARRDPERPGSGSDALSAERRVHAPTPTDEPCTLPALLVGTFPLDPSRRHVAAGAVTDTLVSHAGRTWADLLIACRDADVAPDPLDLMPPALPAGELDAALWQAASEAARDVPLLAPVGGGPPIAGPQAVVLTGPAAGDRAALAGLARWMANLVDLAPRHSHLVRLLGVGTTGLSDVVDALPHTTAAEHRALYEAFSGATSSTIEELATLPVPLADGRTVRGARGLVVLDGGLHEVADDLATWGIRAVHPDAVHPLLERLGAAPVDAAALLHHPAVRERVLDENDDDHDQVADVLLALFRAAVQDGVTLTPAPWWGELLLPAQDGDLVPARGLALAGSPASGWYDQRILPLLDAEAARTWADVAEVVGVRVGLTVVVVDLAAADMAATDMAAEGRPAEGSGPAGRGPADAGDPSGARVGGGDVDLTTESLDGWEEYLDLLADSGADVADLGEVSAVADLDAVLPGRWHEVLRAMSGGPARRALLDPVRVGTAMLPSYTAWWLRRRAGLGLDRPFSAAAPGPGAGTGPLAALLAPMPPVLAGLDREVLRALGGVAGPGDLDRAGWADLLDSLPQEGDPVTVPLALQVWRGLAALATADAPVELDPERLPALVAPGQVRMTEAGRVAVATPMWAQHTGALPVLVTSPAGVAALAEALDLDVAADRAPGRITSPGHPVATPVGVRELFPAAPATWVEHEDLRVDGEQVDWWVSDGEVNAATTAGLARGLATLVGWTSRAAIERLVGDPSAVAEVAIDLAGDSVAPGPDPQV